ncbi:1-aminocyclopropane-1-carboxylate oxidase [Acorus calamus]|uniref:1-aminocyclopropane-1-carboxylate oxidase n=1 Tax=Acorus calamus TaxID=4465 RepID=A0AAV9E8W3_ACOCL|nr:1-aminocyclopropane-1-carboxylate oxidase [Acorus calamus]
MIHETIPTVILSPFFIDDEEAASKERVTETIRRACEAHGFFQIVDHGVPLHLTRRALQLSRAFFARSYEDKLMSKPLEGSRSPLPAGYARQPVQSADKNEYLLMFSPESGFNVYPSNPPQFSE